MTITAPPKRVFDPMMPRMGHYRPIPDTEDKAFSDWLQSQLDEIFSLSEEPPRCPHCQGDETVLATRAAHPKPVLPVFRCVSCDVHFRRTTGTPLSGLKFHNLPQFIALLSQQRPVTDAAAILDVKAATVTRWIKRMRQWILHLDPTGYWEAKVRLGMEIRPDIGCPHCGVADHMHYRGFASDTGDRLCRCDACGRFSRLSGMLSDQGPSFVLEHRVVVRPPSPRRKA
jgi:transposase-like protein